MTRNKMYITPFLLMVSTLLLLQQHKNVNAKSPMEFLVEKCPGRRTKEQRENISSCARWSIGMEHETMYVHRTEDGLEEFVVNIGKVAKQMSLYGRIHGLDRQEHAIAVDLIADKKVELSGRVCSGVNEINFRSMAESVSTDHSENTFDSVFCHVSTLDGMAIDILNANPSVSKMSEELGPVSLPRAGMSSELGVYTRTRGQNFMCASCGSCDLKDYTGSFHISISLPTNPSNGRILKDETAMIDKDTCAPAHQRRFMELISSISTISSPRDEWISAHENLANMFQWVEPIMVSAMGAADADSVCDEGKFTEGSYRTGAIGWGVPGTTDVRTFSEYATGRLCGDGSGAWLTEMETAYKDALGGCIEKGMGSDIRVRSSVDEHLLHDGESLPPMELGEGIELRSFDNFPIQHMPQVHRLVALLAETSRVHTAPRYIYDDDGWKGAMQEVMREGWNGILPTEYITALEEVYNIDLSHLGGTKQAFAVFKAVYTALWDAHADGFWTNLLLDSLPEEMPEIANPNRESWEIGARNSGVTPKELQRILDLGSESHVVVSDLQMKGAGGCGEDIEDFIYLAETYGIIDEIFYHTDGSVESFSHNSRRLEGLSNFTSPLCNFKGEADELTTTK